MSDAVDSPQGPQADPLTTLVIDDETMVRQIVRRALEPKICRVAEAASGEEGLRIIERDCPPINVVLTDLKMPGLDGWDVVEVLARYRPDLPVGVMTGYGGATAARAQNLGARLLPKPFTASALTELISSLVADARAMQARAGAHRARAERARETNALLREQHAELRLRLDLVASAWDLHRRLHLGEDPGTTRGQP